MARLSPKEAANAASSVYQLKNSATSSMAIKDLNDDFKNKFIFNNGTRFKGQSGGYIIKSESGFGVVAQGVKGSAFENQALIAIRGTKGIPDLLTDTNVGMRTNKSGNMIHTGFDRSFKSFRVQLSEYFIKNPVSYVHIAGHSLGGALATLTADWIRYNKIAKASLYTFGCPRVGSESFARDLTKRIGADNIYRTYHRSDPVPMVPVWPFTHLPTPGVDCYIKDAQMVPYLNMHYMEQYSQSVAKASDWAALRVNQPAESLNHQIKNWLNNASLPVALSLGPYYMIGAAISYVIKKLAGLGVIAIQAGFSVGFTAIDWLAKALTKAHQVSKEMSGLVMGLMRRILQALGMVSKMVTNLTIEFIRWVLKALTRVVYDAARRAINVYSMI